MAAPGRVEVPRDVIAVRGARVHNLKDLNVDLPRTAFTVVTGLSGSGKSSLAFDVLFNEGQRRFLDCLSPYVRQYLPPANRPDVDTIAGLPPTVAISQRTTRGGRKSTVATMADVYPYLRLLWARVGVQHCAQCGRRISGLAAGDLAEAIARSYRGQEIYVMSPAVRGRKGWHKEVFERARKLGHRFIHVDGSVVSALAVSEVRRYNPHDIDYVVGRLRLTGTEHRELLARTVEQAMALGDGVVTVRGPDRKVRVYSRERYCHDCGIGYEAPDPLTFAFTSARGWCDRCLGTGVEPDQAEQDKAAKKKKKEQQTGDKRSREALEKAATPDGGEEIELAPVRHETPCAACGGARISALARSVRVGSLGIHEALALGPGELREALHGLVWTEREAKIAVPIVREVSFRCDFLERVGLDYLALGRGAQSLSGGESQRIRLAAQLSSNLTGVLYVLDEPTIGLHPADNARVLEALDAITARGNGVLVVEHDEDTIRHATHLIELGPAGGAGGGEIVAQGTLADLLADPHSPTGRALREPHVRRVRLEPRAVDAETPRLRLRGANLHNLADVDVEFPLGRLILVTGVSGSGKSTLVRDVLAPAVHAIATNPKAKVVLTHAQGLSGAEAIARVLEVDQSPIGRTPRSCPATYIGVLDPIRKLFAGLPEARLRGFGPAHFSFNAAAGGRCETCAGAGNKKLEMSFLADAWVPCEACNGRRYTDETLRVRWRDASIHDVLSMTAQDAAAFFANVKIIHEQLILMEKIGLGYLTLGQASNTLSGGEAQRIKIVAELATRGRGHTLYVMDEPSTGLHLQDTTRLLSVLHALVDRGHTVILIEHHLDLLRESDWVVDLGPGGGSRGGRVVYQGPVDGLLALGGHSATAAALRDAVS